MRLDWQDMKMRRLIWRVRNETDMEKLEKNAIEILHLICGNTGCVIADSGGKDSSVLKHIALKAHDKYGLPFSIRHNHTTVDAPETVYFVRDEKKKFDSMGIKYEISYPLKTMWQLIVSRKTPPTRVMRYCCAELKENTGFGEKLVTGVRKAESKNRLENQGTVTFPKPKKQLINQINDNENFILTNKGGVVILNLDNSETRRVVENCYRTHKTLINPLIDWSDDFLYWYIRKENIQLNPLYGCGWNRVGCIGCPMAGKHRWAEFERYPKYKDAYIRAFDKMLIEREKSGLKSMDTWSTGKKVFKWWMEDDNLDGQLSFDMNGEIYEKY